MGGRGYAETDARGAREESTTGRRREGEVGEFCDREGRWQEGSEPEEHFGAPGVPDGSRPKRRLVHGQQRGLRGPETCAASQSRAKGIGRVQGGMVKILRD